MARPRATALYDAEDSRLRGALACVDVRMRAPQSHIAKFAAGFIALRDALRALQSLINAGEFARAVAQQIAQRSIPATDAPAADTPTDEDSPAALAARFAAITDPRAQTAFWRSLTAEQRTAILKAQ